MKQALLFPLVTICILHANAQLASVEKSMTSPFYSVYADSDSEGGSSTPAQTTEGKMSAAVFKAQEFCRAELKDFEFETRFSIVSATVYFSGANFKNVQKGVITSSSLKPIRNFMERCTPGSIVIFDEVKVLGPDNKLRTIPGLSVMLY